MSAVEIRNLAFSYEKNPKPIFDKFSLTIPIGSRVLLAGANGVGKSTLLRIIAGKHMVSSEIVSVLGDSPFHNTSLSQQIALVNGDFPVTLDLKVSELLSHHTGDTDKKREKELLQILGVDPSWRMHQVSEGQRRRVQLLLAFRKKIKLYLLDEITTHLDVLVRADFLDWLRRDNEAQGSTIIYTTHIFDGLWTVKKTPWPTHMAFLIQAGLKMMRPIKEIKELDPDHPSPILRACGRWMRADAKRSQASGSRSK